MKHPPSELQDMLSLLRHIANFAAHPKKATHTNEIIEVEKGEAELLLEIIYELFDYQFVRPERQKNVLTTIKEKYGL